MQIFKHTFTVNCNIDTAWNFYTDIKHLEIITPKEMNLKVLSTTDQTLAQGQEAVIEGKISPVKRKWHSKITSLKPYEYTDEMLKGPFKKWKHIHKFQKINEKETKIIDEIEFELSYGIIGRLFERYAYRQLTKIFEHRKTATINTLEIN